MSYLTQYIQESQVRYPTISKTPIDVITHLLYVNGNGVDMVNGNPVMYGSFYRDIPFKDYYVDEVSLEKMIEITDRNSEEEIQENFVRNEEFNEIFEKIGSDKHLDEKSLWNKSVDQYQSRYENVDFITNYSSDDLLDIDIMKKMMEDSEDRSGFYSNLHLSRNYYNQDEFSTKTDSYLLKIGFVYSTAAVLHFRELLEKQNDIVSSINNNDENSKRLSYSKEDSQLFFDVLKRDIVILEEDIITINNHLKYIKADFVK